MTIEISYNKSCISCNRVLSNDAVDSLLSKYCIMQYQSSISVHNYWFTYVPGIQGRMVSFMIHVSYPSGIIVSSHYHKLFSSDTVLYIVLNQVSSHRSTFKSTNQQCMDKPKPEIMTGPYSKFIIIL